MNKNIRLNKKKHKCEMCGNEALPFNTLCEAHWELRIAEQTKGKSYVNSLIRPYGANK